MAPPVDGPALSALRAVLVRQAARQLTDEHEAEDVAQDALIALCTTTTTFADVDHVAAYARRTVHNLCVDRIRRRARHASLEHADLPYDTLEEDVITREVVGDLVAALGELNPAYASVLIASTEVGRSHAQIAELTGVSLRNVRHGLDRGTKALKEKLAAAGHSLSGLLTPAPITRLVRALVSSPRGRRVVVGTAVAGVLPTLLLLIPSIVAPHEVDRPGVAVHEPAIARWVPPVTKQRLVSSRFFGTDPFNDRDFARDAAALLRSERKLKPDQCVLVSGHGVCQTQPNQSYVYYTVKVPRQTGLPDVQVYGSDLPPCRTTVPANPEVTCEQGHPPTPPPFP